MPHRLQKRINIEMNNINNLDNCFCEQSTVDFNKINVYIFKISCVFHLELTLTPYYPFSPPFASLIGKETEKYQNILGAIQAYFNTFDKQICLCCNTLICKDKWGPSNKLIDIVKEVNKIFDICEKEINNTMRNKILLKHLGYVI